MTRSTYAARRAASSTGSGRLKSGARDSRSVECRNQHLHELVQLDGLDEVRLEASLAGAAAIGFLAMAGHGNELFVKVDAGYRVIAIGGFGRESDIAASKNAGFDVHLTKPVDFEVLSDALRTLNGRH
jgi:hypothetical protein